MHPMLPKYIHGILSTSASVRLWILCGGIVAFMIVLGALLEQRSHRKRGGYIETTKEVMVGVGVAVFFAFAIGLGWLPFALFAIGANWDEIVKNTKEGWEKFKDRYLRC